jgi:hypothetical protein
LNLELPLKLDRDTIDRFFDREKDKGKWPEPTAKDIEEITNPLLESLERALYLNTPQNKDEFAKRKSLVAEAKLDETAKALIKSIEKFASQFLLSVPGREQMVVEISSLLIHLGRDCNNSFKSEMIESFVKLSREHPEVMIAALRLFTDRKELPVPRSILDRCESLGEKPLSPNRQDSAHIMALFNLYASRLDVPVPIATFEGRLKKFSDVRLGKAEVVVAGLRVLEKRTDIKVSEEFLSSLRPRPTNDPSEKPIMNVRRLMLMASNALAINSAIDRVIISRDLHLGLNRLRSYQGRSNDCALALETILSEPKLLANYSLREIILDRPVVIETKRKLVSFEEMLRNRDSDAEAGNDHRRADMIVGKILPYFSGPNAAAELKNIRMPLLNLLTDVRNINPDAWAGLDNRVAEQISVRAAKLLLEQRHELLRSGRTILGPGVKLIALCHEESRFNPSTFKEMTERFGMQLVGIFKGTEHRSDTFLEKQKFLRDVATAAVRSDQPTVMYMNCHGGPNHFFLSNGSVGHHHFEDMHLPNAVSYKEYAEAMIDAQRLNGKTTIDLSHLTCIHDACYQHQFAEKFFGRLQEYAAENNLKLTGVPLFVSASQRDTPGFSAFPFKSLLLHAIESIPRDKKSPFTVQDLFSMDGKMVADVDQIRSAKLQSLKTGTSRFGSDTSLIAEDPGIFGPKVQDRNKMLERILGSADLLADFARQRDMRSAPPPISGRVDLSNGPDFFNLNKKPRDLPNLPPPAPIKLKLPGVLEIGAIEKQGAYVTV